MPASKYWHTRYFVEFSDFAILILCNETEVEGNLLFAFRVTIAMMHCEGHDPCIYDKTLQLVLGV